MKPRSLPPKPKAWLAQMLLVGLVFVAWAGWEFWHYRPLGLIDTYYDSKMFAAGLVIVILVAFVLIKRR
jgi:hypothetical protein